MIKHSAHYEWNTDEHNKNKDWELENLPGA